MNQAQALKAMAIDAYNTLRERGHNYPLKLVKKRMIAARHAALYNIPRSLNGQKLGLRKREMVAESLRVKE